MMKWSRVWMVLLFVTSVMLMECTPGSTYERKLKRELASGERNDSLFFGIYLGMPEKEFYTHCWNLNRQGLVKQGSRNVSVEYLMKDELNHEATMNFYPTFAREVIVEMPVQFIYGGWSPWTHHLSADSLQLDVLNWYEGIYGNGFMKVEHPARGVAYVKIDGNRRISIFTEDEKYVWAVFTDMLAMNELKDSLSVEGDLHKDIIRESEN